MKKKNDGIQSFVFSLQSSVISHGNLEFIEIFQIKLNRLPDNCAFFFPFEILPISDRGVVTVFDYYDDFFLLVYFFPLKSMRFIRWHRRSQLFSLSFPHSDMSFFSISKLTEK